jgi:hypothetical protein
MELWSAVDGMLGRAALPGILSHRLGPLEANRLRRLDQPLGDALAAEERAASLSMLTGIPLIQRVREHSDGVLVLIKGPELAHLYPGTARRFSDIDVLTEDAAAAQAGLIEAGFLELHDPLIDVEGGHHHLQPLRWPTIWLKVEMHMSPNWPRGARPPRLEEILEARVPSASGVEGVFAPTPLHHALILAAHGWLHEPLDILRDLVDIAAVCAEVDERELERTAAAWGLRRLWATTRSTIDALFYDGPSTVPLRSWARHLEFVRERTVLERHVGRLVQGYWALPPHRAALETARALPYLIKPVPGETWSGKAKRVGRALRSPGKLVGRRGGR